MSLEVTNRSIKSPVLPGFRDPEETQEMVLFSFAQVFPLGPRQRLTAFASFHSGTFGQTAKRKRRSADILQGYFVILLEINKVMGKEHGLPGRCDASIK